MYRNKRLIDYSPDFERVKFKQIVTVWDSLMELLSVREMDEAVVHLSVIEMDEAVVHLFVYNYMYYIRPALL